MADGRGRHERRFLFFTWRSMKRAGKNWQRFDDKIIFLLMTNRRGGRKRRMEWIVLVFHAAGHLSPQLLLIGLENPRAETSLSN